MDERLLIKHIMGECTDDEAAQVIAWVDSDPANEKEYISLLNSLAVADIVGKTEEALPAAKRGRSASVVWKVAALAASLVAILSILLNLDRKSGSGLLDNIAEIEHTYYTDAGIKGRIVLPDSSVVWLNSCSKITFPDKFAEDARRVGFEGEGYFEVMSNPDCPMIVTTPKGMEVKVLGTKFSIRSYPDDTYENATLYSGKVTVTGAAGTREIVPGEAMYFRQSGKATLQHQADTASAIAWKRGDLVFNHTPMTEVCRMLERWHGMNVVIKDQNIETYDFTAQFGSESMVQILELMKYTMPLDYNITGNTVYISKK